MLFNDPDEFQLYFFNFDYHPESPLKYCCLQAVRKAALLLRLDTSFPPQVPAGDGWTAYAVVYCVSFMKAFYFLWSPVWGRSTILL